MTKSAKSPLWLWQCLGDLHVLKGPPPQPKRRLPFSPVAALQNLAEVRGVLVLALAFGSAVAGGERG